MKKLLTLFLILALLLPAAALADYTPELGMTISEFIQKYNAVQAPLGAPYMPLLAPFDYSYFKDYTVTWFSPTNDKNVTILLMSKDKDQTNALNAGLDAIQIYTSNSDSFVDLICITARCTDLFAANIFGMSIGELNITRVMRYYYENNLKAMDQISYIQINEEENKYIGFFCAAGDYYFQISPMEAFNQ